MFKCLRGGFLFPEALRRIDSPQLCVSAVYCWHSTGSIWFASVFLTAHCFITPPAQPKLNLPFQTLSRSSHLIFDRPIVISLVMAALCGNSAP